MKDAKRFCEISTLILSTVLGIFSWQHHSPVYCDVTIEILETLIPFKDLLKTRHFCFKVLFRKFLEIWTFSIYQRDALSLVHLTFYMHFEWEMMLGEYICILKSQSASKGVTHLRKPSSIQFTNPQKYICKWMEICLQIHKDMLANRYLQIHKKIFTFWRANLPARESVIWENLHQFISQIHKKGFSPDFNTPKFRFRILQRSDGRFWTPHEDLMADSGHPLKIWWQILDTPRTSDGKSWAPQKAQIRIFGSS